MSGGTQNSVRPPRQGTPSPPPSDFPVGWPLCGGECRAEVRWCGETFQTGPTGKVRTVRKRGTERTALAFQRSAQVGIGTTYNGMRRRSAVGAGWESVHIQRSLRWMSRSDGNWGPRFCSTAPAQHPHSSSIRFPRGLAGRSVETRAGSTCDACDGAAELFKPGPTRRCGR